MALLNVFKRKKLAEREAVKEKKEPKKKKDEKPLVSENNAVAVAKPTQKLGWSGGILIAPHVTEKSSGLVGLHQYVFRVSPSANKLTIARAVEKKYGVTVLRVNTMNVHGKRVRVGRTEGRSPGFKKAMVTLKEGQSIEIQ